MEKDELLFYSLIAMLHAAVMQSLGKTHNPLSGAIERNLDQAQAYIDMLAMIKTKTQGNLADAEQQSLDDILTECRLNYVDEKNKPEPPAPAQTAAEPPGEQ